MSYRSKTLELLREHDASPGTSYEERLIIGGGLVRPLYEGALHEGVHRQDPNIGVINFMELHESTDSLGHKLVKFRGKLQEADAINKNNRKYTKAILEQNVKSLQDILEHGGLVGELDHPSDSIVHFANASHKITKLWWDGNILMGEGYILQTPSGKVLEALINGGVRIGMSSRGVGNGKVDGNGVLVIGESYKLITFDAVADPSTYAAFQERVVNAKESVVPTLTQHKQAMQEQIPATNSIKNENSGIHKIADAKLWKACLSSMVRNKTNEIKARLS